MTAGPGDGQGAGGVWGREVLRASDADREQLIDTLKAAFVQGRLTRDELAARTGQALESRTLGELTALWAGIPAGAQEARPAAQAARAQARARAGAQAGPDPASVRARRPVGRNVVAWGAGVIAPPALVAVFITYYGGFLVLFLLAFAGTILTGGAARDGAPRR